MKNIFLLIGSNALIICCIAQQTTGRILYERTMQMDIHLAGHDEAERMMPKTHTDKFELIFGNNQSLLKHVDEDVNDDVNGNGMQIRMIGPGLDDIIYNNFGTGQKVEQKDIFDRKFIVADSIKKLNWKLTDETQILLGHVCHKAMAERMGKSFKVTMENGKIEKKAIDDTNTIVAWFTSDIPVPAGPEVQGQLPGLILALDINNGRMIYKALELSTKADTGDIKEPVKGKKVTPDGFNKERDKMLEEMEKNNNGNGSRAIRIKD